VEETQWYRYVRRISGDAKATEIADRAGFDKSALTRWKQGLSPDPLFVVKFARAYGRPIVEALVEAGVITETEAAVKEVRVGAEEALRLAQDEALIDELRDRLLNRIYVPEWSLTSIEDSGIVGPDGDTAGNDELGVFTADELKERDLRLAALRDQKGTTHGNDARPRP